MALKMMSYNIHMGVELAKGRDEHLKEQLGGISPDIVCLQEFPLENQRLFNDLKGLGMRFFSYHKMCHDFFKGDQALLTLSRFPIIQQRHSDLSVTWAPQPRSLLLSQIQTPQGLIWVGNLHLGLIQSERLMQLKKLELILGELQENPLAVFLMGDFNDWRQQFGSSKFLQTHFQEAFLSLHGRYARTFPSLFPLLPLDRIYFQKAQMTQAHRPSGRPWRRFSDHLPLFAYFSL